MIWLNVPRPPCFKGIVTKNVSQSLENSGSSFWEKKTNSKRRHRHCHKYLSPCRMPSAQKREKNVRTKDKVMCIDCTGRFNGKGIGSMLHVKHILMSKSSKSNRLLSNADVLQESAISEVFFLFFIEEW